MCLLPAGQSTSQIDYVNFDYGGSGVAVTSGKSKTYSFDYYGTKGGAISFYSWAGGSFDGVFSSNCTITYQDSTSVQLQVPTNRWVRMNVTLTNGYYGTGWMVLHSDIGSTTLSSSDYYLFRNIQMEMKKNPTKYLNTGTRSGTFTTVSECISWASTQYDISILSRNYDNIVTNGLVLYLDSFNTNSYPASGTIWYDISGRNKNFSINIQSTPSYSNGVLQFQYQTGYISTLLDNDITDDMTIECWYMPINMKAGCCDTVFGV